MRGGAGGGGGERGEGGEREGNECGRLCGRKLCNPECSRVARSAGGEGEMYPSFVEGSLFLSFRFNAYLRTELNPDRMTRTSSEKSAASNVSFLIRCARIGKIPLSLEHAAGENKGSEITFLFLRHADKHR